MTPRRQRVPWLVLALTLALAATGLMALHTVRHVMRMRRSSESIRPWMSIPYIARSRHVPAEGLYKSLGLPPNRHDRRPLGRIARQQGRPLDELIARIETAIAHAREQPPRQNGSVP